MRPPTWPCDRRALRPRGPTKRPTAAASEGVALAHRIDTLVGFGAWNEKPTWSSKDPFGALPRRAWC